MLDYTPFSQLFLYEEVSKGAIVCDSEGTFFAHSDAVFTTFGYVGDDSRFTAKLPDGERSWPPGGWKLHIALDDQASGNIANAWNNIKNILIKYGINQSKVIRPGVTLSSDLEQCGKQITIYQFFNPDRNWQLIVREMEAALLAARVAPGEISPSDKRVPGSQYISYRNDLSKDGLHYVRATTLTTLPQESRHNPYGRTDPFSEITIEAEHREEAAAASTYTPKIGG